MNTQNNECCPKFNPEKWDRQILNWESKPFIKESLPTFFHIPFPPMIGSKITKMMKAAEAVHAVPQDKTDALILFHDPSAFKSELFLSVTGNVPEADNVSISGTFMSRVFDGPYNDIPKFIKQMDGYLAEAGKKAKDYYVHYAYCPKCQKKFGHNYVVLFAQVGVQA